ncbi:MAG: hypothetical protein ACRCS8_03855 [Brevinema sp.]
MKNKSVILLSCLIFISFFAHAKEVIIKDFTGDAEYQSHQSKMWIPILTGMKISEKNFIRLNSKDSIITMELPDGSLLRLIGVGSIFIDYLSESKNNATQHKFLLITGRWFYSASSRNKSRLIMNTDITTSIIENGSGGGYFFDGKHEFLIRNGSGMTSYREQNSRAIVVDERQVIEFNIYDGFGYPELATPKKFEEYIILIDSE